MRNPEVGVEGGAFEPHEIFPRPMLIQVTGNYVKRVASQITGGDGINGINIGLSSRPG